MELITKHRKNGKTIREWKVSPAEVGEMMAQGKKFRTATIHETMGPNWKDIYWLQFPSGSGQRPVVLVD